MYMDLCLCKFEDNKKLYLFRAPRFSYLSGKEVIVETKHGLEKATVVKSMTVEPFDENYEFAVSATGATEPLKRVVSVVRYDNLEYNEETEDKWT